VPKFLVNADGSLGARNDVQCVSLEHKLGIHASPTAVLAYGDHGGAVGQLVGLGSFVDALAGPLRQVGILPTLRRYDWYRFSAKIGTRLETNRFFIYRHPLEETRPYFDLTFAYVMGLAELVQSSGARFLLVVAPRFQHWNPKECPKYAGLHVLPQLGLLPIGRDPDSGLWEFAQLLSGDPAVRGANGKLVLTEGMGLVFVLLPGGTFTMGAQAKNPSAPNYDPQAASIEAPHAVTLSAFFLSKYELTQGQWLRFTGRNPSNYGPHDYERGWNLAGRAVDLLHPVEQVSWTMCMDACSRLGLSLPSEAQWEYGARAGTETPWWTGADPHELASAGNVADAWARTHGATADWNCEEWDDGNTVHAAVGSYRANPFGLHDVIANVWEWCEDKYEATDRVSRGGSFCYAAVNARASYRNGLKPEFSGPSLGLRPARTIAP